LSSSPNEETEEQRIARWANPKIKELTRYYHLSNLFRIIAIVLLLFAIAVQWWWASQVPPPPPWIYVFPYAVLFAAALIARLALKKPRLTPAESYIVGLVAIKEQSQRVLGGSPDEFHDAVGQLIGRIDVDMRKYRYSIAASRTYRMLKDLRSILLRFATVIDELNKSIDHVEARKDLESAIGHAIIGFHRFDDIEGYVNNFLPLELENTSEVTESKYPLSRKRALKKYAKGWYRLPPPVNLVIFEVIFLSPIVLAPFSAWFPSLMPQTEAHIRITAFFVVAAAVGAAFTPPLRKWVKSRLA
jgi:hypothetical protein